MHRLFQFSILSAIMLLAALAVSPAYAQGFMVEPMTMRVNPLPRQSIDVPLKIYNTAIDGPRRILLRLVDLSENDQGRWTLIEPGAGAPPPGNVSSLAWTSLSADSATIGPQQPAAITVTLRPPANARGAYFAGIVAETPLPANPKGIVVRTRFLIPLIIEIRGRTVQERVALNDVAMAYDKAAKAGPTTTAAMSIVNSGRTFSRVKGQITVERQNGELWRVVTRLPVEERGIIPGVTLKLGGDLERRLPTGAYRLRADLFVDGRRVVPMQKLIQFKGDPKAKLAYDATLEMQPGMVDMKVVPGATRTTVLHIVNTNPDPIRIEMGSRTPRGLVGVQMGDVIGTSLSAQPWTSIQPSSFTLRPNGRQNVRVISTVPKEGVDYPNYYADLTLKGTYPDGQSAGETFSTIHLDNADLKSSPNGAIEQASLAEGDDAKFIAELRFTNIGNVDYVPAASVSLLSTDGAVVETQALSGDAEALLPLGKRTFSGELDFAAVKPGSYVLKAAVTIAPAKEITRRYIVEVADEAATGADGTKVPTVTLSDPGEAVAAGTPDAKLDEQPPVPVAGSGAGQ